MTETQLNEKITRGLRAQFSEERGSRIIEEAYKGFHYHNPHSATNPELYELFESGLIDSALETLGFGRWAIGRPKPGNGDSSKRNSKPRLGIFRHKRAGGNGQKTVTVTETANVNSAQQTVTAQPSPQLAASGWPTLSQIFEQHLPGEFPQSRGFSDNAIEFRNVLIIGGQGSGKTTVLRRMAEITAEKYGHSKVRAYMETAGISKLLWLGTKYPSLVRLLGAEDMTLKKIPRDHLNSWFQVRHIIAQRTGWRTGLVIASSNVHTLFGLEKNLRTDFNLMILLTIPTNPYDRSLLKRYFDKDLLDTFEQTARKGDALIWDRYHNSGQWITIDYPVSDLLVDLTGYGRPKRLYRILFIDLTIAGCAIALAYVLYIMVTLIARTIR